MNGTEFPLPKIINKALQWDEQGDRQFLDTHLIMATAEVSTEGDRTLYKSWDGFWCGESRGGPANATLCAKCRGELVRRRQIKEAHERSGSTTSFYELASDTYGETDSPALPVRLLAADRETAVHEFHSANEVLFALDGSTVDEARDMVHKFRQAWITLAAVIVDIDQGRGRSGENR
jgi:hypothetical protein